MSVFPHRWRLLAGGTATCALAVLLVAAVPRARPRPQPVVRAAPPAMPAPGSHVNHETVHHLGNSTIPIPAGLPAPGSHVNHETFEHRGNSTIPIPGTGRGGVNIPNGSVSASAGVSAGMKPNPQASGQRGRNNNPAQPASGPNNRRFAEEFLFRDAQMMMPMGGAQASIGYGSAMPGYPYGPPAASYYGGRGANGAGMGAGAAGGGAPGVRVGGAGDDRDDEKSNVSELLSAAGLPNEDGRPLWPVGLRALPAPEAKELTGQIDALLATQAKGSPNPRASGELTAAVEALRQALRRDKDERFSLTGQAYEDAEAFLVKLDRAGKSLAAAAEPPARELRSGDAAAPRMPEADK